MHRARLDDRERRVAFLPAERRAVDAMARARAQEPVAREDHGHRFVDHGQDVGDRDALGLLDEGAASVAEFLCVFAYFGRGELAALRGRTEQAFERSTFLLQLRSLALDLDAFQPRELAQPYLEDVLGLALGEAERLDELGLRLVGVADHLDHFVDGEEGDHPAFEDVNPLGHFVEAMAQPALDHHEAEGRPFGDHLREPHLARAPVGADRDQVHRHVGFHRGVREEEGHQLVGLDLAGARLEDEAHGMLAVGIVALGLQQRKGSGLEARLVGRERLLARLRLGIGELLDLGEHARGRGVGR